MSDEILNIELKFLKGICSRLSFYVEFKHFSEPPKYKILTCFEFAHWDGPLGFAFLLNDIKHRALTILLHRSLGSWFKECVNGLVGWVFIFEVGDGFDFGHFEAVFLEEVFAVLYRETMVLGVFLDNSIENDLDLIVLGDVLMVLMSAMLSEECFGVELLFELLNLWLWKWFKHG